MNGVAQAVHLRAYLDIEIAKRAVGDGRVTVARKTMERDGLTPTLIMTTALQRPEVPQAATDAYAVTRARTSRSSRIGETCKGDPSLTGRARAE
jgi:hypothetical protein